MNVMRSIDDFVYMGANGRLQLTAAAFVLFSDERTSPIPGSGKALEQRVTSSMTLDRQGLLTGIMVSVAGTLSCIPSTGGSGTITGGTWRNYPNPVPFGILRRIELSSGTGVNLFDSSAFGMHILDRVGYGRDMSVSTSATSRFSDEQAYLGGRFISSSYGFQSGYGGAAIPTGTFTAAAPIGISTNFQFYLPVAMNPELTHGMISLQQNSTDYTLKLTTGDITGGLIATGGSNDFFSGLTGTAMAWTWTGTASADMITRTPLFPAELQKLVSDHTGYAIDQPIYLDDLLQWAHNYRTNFQSGLVNGRNIIEVSSTDLILGLYATICNAGVPLTRADLQNPTLSHSGAQTVRQEGYATQGARQFRFTGNELPNGTLAWPLNRGRGLVMHPDLDDALNNTKVTSVQAKFDIPSSTVLTAAAAMAPTGIDLGVQSLVAVNQLVGD